MSQDPYTPPASNLEVADTKRGSAIKAVVVGLAADIGGTIVVSLLAAIVYGGYLGATGNTPEETAASMQAFSYDSPLGIALASVGTLFSVLGGFICARIARHSEYRLGLIMGAVSLVLVLLTTGNEDHAIMTALPLVATLAAIMVGVHLGVLKNKKGGPKAALVLDPGPSPQKRRPE